MINAQELNDTLAEWFTGKLPNGDESPRVGWRDIKGGGLRIRKAPSTELLASMFARPGHMVRVSLVGGRIRIEIEERAPTPSKGDGNPQVALWRHATESIDHVTQGGVSLAERRRVGAAEAAKQARIAAMTAQETAALAAFNDAQEQARLARKLAERLGVLE